ncbi:MAG TPA: TetR/AcrR family transcriptional regulator [Microthrixaceae bacterium]|nr:TetR/AcrR family transcriptional regulator [Microthrixaceae bacterium]RTL06266.1 MAG: TetR/AcrR family transcriptional regulator [Acidimicrobiia bacterium]MCB9375014.1 TetR/AcrR family transcriptional regulator [Microthrixaceae bacterium]MCB9401886.1 TetR/AcrR family transcriptional regulator [Microthrixaceae bacterium]MCO5306468.1 TetR/AcrR family transcriptional regulator [Microthrixaceae bacterium]
MPTAHSVATRPNQRDHILDTALRLMSERGAKGMTMRQLASACDLQVAAIYHYFESKDALLAAVVAERQYGSRMSDAFPIDPAADAADRLRSLFGHVWAGALEEQSIWRLLISEGMHGEAAVLPVGQALLELLEPATRGWIERFVPEVDDPSTAAKLIVGQLLTGFVRHVFEPDRDPVAVGAECAEPVVVAVFGPGA